RYHPRPFFRDHREIPQPRDLVAVLRHVEDQRFSHSRLEVEMKLALTDPPREFGVGTGGAVRLKDCAHIALEPDEQVTFQTESGGEYDVVRKSWGFYATPSLNGRLERFNLRAVLVKSCR